ncbi:hypothetical protein JZ751_017208, partial [Albula glossodonta]
MPSVGGSVSGSSKMGSLSTQTPAPQQHSMIDAPQHTGTPVSLLYPVSAISPTVDRSPQQQSAVCRHRSGSSYSGERHRAHKQKHIFNVVKQGCSARRTQPVLTLDPDWPQIFTGERITLRCQSQEDTSKGFSWFRHEPQRQEVHRSIGDSYTIPPAAVGHSGSYDCCVNETQFICSTAVRLTVSALPKATLTVEPKWSLLYTGETVTLKCEVDSDGTWTYFWYKDWFNTALSQTAGHSVSGNRYSITAAAGSDQGQYWCEGRLEGRKVTSQRSDPITLTVKGRTQPVLALDPDWPQIFTGERITLRCQSQEDTSKGFSWYKGGNYEYQTSSSRENSYTISPATEAHSGSYTCCLVALHDTCSAAVTLTVSVKPRPVLTVSPWGQIYAGESVSLSCSVTETSVGWDYWYESKKLRARSYDNIPQTRGVKDSYTLSPAALTHSGEYRCRAGRGNPVLVTEYTLPKATLTIEPKWRPVYYKETVTLKCEVDFHSAWTYVWYNDQLQTAVSQTAGHSVSGDRYSITAAAGSDQGQYWCEGRLEGRKVTSQRSDHINLTVKGRTQPVLTLDPDWPQIFTGERITLRCKSEEDMSEGLSWYKGGIQMSRTYSSWRDSNTISSATLSHSGSYTCCLAALHDTCSAAVTLTVSEKPRPVLTVSPWGQIYAGESVSLSCSVTETSAALNPVALTHSGEYRCRAGRGNPVWVTEYSEPVHIQVSALPKATLTVEPKWSPLYTGETVTLKCEVDSHSNWKYVWYKDQLQTAVSQTAGHSVSGDRYSITAAAGSDQGQYWCEGRLEGRKVTSQRSDPITLTVKALPKAALSVEPEKSPLYTGETVTLKCEVDSHSNWKYVWYKGRSRKVLPQTAGHSVRSDRYSITAAAGSDQGQYWCEGRLEGRKVTSQRSDPITLTVKGECKSQEDTSEGFSWYKGGNYEYQPFSSRENSYTISPATKAHSGSYTCCLVALHDTCSAAVTLTVSALPRATLTVEPKWSPLYTGETVTLKCEEDSHSTWKYVWYKDQLQTAMSQTAGHSVSGDRYSIPAAAGSDQGQYWCEGRLEGRKVTSQRSDLITLTVEVLPKANLTVEPKWSPLYTGDNITLKCEVGSPGNWMYVWYKDQFQMAMSQTAGHSVSGNRYSITAAAGSDQGQYWCEGRLEGRNRTSQRSDPITLTVKASLQLLFIPHTLSLQSECRASPQGPMKNQSIITLAIALGAVAALIVSVLILIFFVKRRRTRGEAVHRASPVYTQ